MIKIPIIPLDKANHFITGAILGGVLSLVLPFWLTIGVVTVAAIAKELYDWNGYGKPEVMDAVASILGGLSVYIGCITF